mmetsp:Transcript_11268/g.24251  ORF Transcript_11268/g.24251 Transcript_11268/m.24251 type:complete len:123 (-) Transcript_11268:130-498(-)
MMDKVPVCKHQSRKSPRVVPLVELLLCRDSSVRLSRSSGEHMSSDVDRRVGDDAIDAELDLYIDYFRFVVASSVCKQRKAALMTFGKKLRLLENNINKENHTSKSNSRRKFGSMLCAPRAHI